jgi:hypothetical protein
VSICTSVSITATELAQSPLPQPLTSIPTAPWHRHLVLIAEKIGFSSWLAGVSCSHVTPSALSQRWSFLTFSLALLR